MHPWHDVYIDEDQTRETFPVVIEVPMGSKNKYELDKESGLLKLDRVLYSAVHYPANYGFIPRSFCDDGDPLDALVLGQEAVVPLCIMHARAIGVIDPGRVRVLAVGRIPDPLGPISALLARCTSVTVSRPSGLTLRHGIFAVPPYDRDRSLLAHELVHTMQYQRAGSLFGFMRRYIFQCLADGYLNAEWEREARELSGRIAN